MAETSVSISCAQSALQLGNDIRSLLEEEGFAVAFDAPEDESNSSWGVDKVDQIDSAFDESVTHCILLLTRDYASDRWFGYRRARLLDVLARRRGFVLPVQVGEEEIDIFGLTHIGKLKASGNDASLIANHFILKAQELREHLPESHTPDVKRILQLYKDGLTVWPIRTIRDSSTRVAYQYLKAQDGVTQQLTHVIFLYEGVAFQPTADAIRKAHPEVGRSGALIVLLPRARSQSQPHRRLENVASIFERSRIKPTNVFYVDDFIWKHCTPTSLQELGPQFPISGFVEPLVDAPNQQSASALKEWYEDSPSPVLVLRGPGGVGKTTLAQDFANHLTSTLHRKIYFVDEPAITDYFLHGRDDISEPFTLYDAYRAALSKLSGTAESLEILSFDRFMMNVDAGNIIVIVDGFDQIVSRLGTRFKVEEFLESIYSTDTPPGRKMIITSRTQFLPDSYFSPQITTLEVLPFDKQRAEFFLSTRFANRPRLIERGVALASSLTRTADSENFFPFLLDIAANMIAYQVASRDEEEVSVDSEDMFEASISSLISMENENDYAIQSICVREYKKYPHGLDPGKQIQVFLELAVSRRGLVPRRDFRSLIETSLSLSVDDSQISALRAHPLLVTDRELVAFRYDVVREYFRNIYVAFLFRDHETVINSEAIAVLSERNKFAPDFLKDVVSRIGLPQDDCAFRVLSIFESFPDVKADATLDVERSKTTLLLILLQQRDLLTATDREGTTDVLHELFGDGTTLTGAALVDVKERVSFDFRGKLVKECSFVNYDHFWECEFDEETIFRECTLMALQRPEGLAISALRGNFDLNTCTVDQSVLEALATKDERVSSARQKLLGDMEKFLRGFHKLGRLLPQKEVVLRARYRGSSEVQWLIKGMKEVGIIVDHSSKKKTLGPELAVNKNLGADVLKFLNEGSVSEPLRRKIRALR